MKTLKCDVCDHEAQGETFEEWMEALQPHYMTAHADIMKQHARNPAEMQAKMGEWMKANKERFEQA